MSPDLKTSAEQRGPVTILTVDGDVDVYAAPCLRDAVIALIRDGRCRIVFAMGGCEFIDSTGLGVITGALKRTVDAGGTAVLADLQPRVGEALRMTGLARVIAIFAAVDEAVSALAGEEAGR